MVLLFLLRNFSEFKYGEHLLNLRHECEKLHVVWLTPTVKTLICSTFDSTKAKKSVPEAKDFPN